MNQHTLVLLKNDCYSKATYPQVMTRILNEGFKITNMAIISPSLDTMEMHYQEHKGKEFFNDVCARMANKPLIVMKVEGVDVIHKMRQLCGKTDCSEKGTIRGDFGTGVKENVIHASSDEESAARELKLWDKYIQ